MKRIAVLAVSMPLAASAQQAAAPAAAAPAPLYQIYGTLNLNAQYVEISKPFKSSPTATPDNAAGRFGISTDSTNIGIKGVADTGMGLGVVYQCETQANLDGQGASGICARNSRLGVTGGWGTLFYGNWDTPYKAAWYGTKADDAFGNTDIYNATALMGHAGGKQTGGAAMTGGGTSGATIPTSAADFETRAANSIAYHSPKFGNMVSFKLQWSTNENASLDGKTSPTVYSAGVNFDMGPLSVFAADEIHDDNFGLAKLGATGATAGGKSSRDMGTKAGVGYELGTPFGTTTVGAVWEYLSFGYQRTGSPALADTAVKEYHRQAVMVNLKHRMGSHELRARYEYADNGDCKLFGGGTCSFDVGRGAQNWAVGYAYYLSTAAQVYAYATKIENERGATYTFTSGGPSVLTGAWGAGADPFGAGVGMRYAF